MPASKDDLLARLARLGIDVETHEHEPLFTVEQSRRIHDEIAGAHSKNLFLKDKKGTLFLVVALQDTEVDLKRLHKVLDCGRLSFGRPELLEEALGVPAGSVTPFALINDTGRRVNVVLDEALMAHRLLNFHPLVNTATSSIKRDDLLKFIADCGHKPRVAALTLSPP